MPGAVEPPQRTIHVRVRVTRGAFSDYVELQGPDHLPFAPGSELGLGVDPVNAYLSAWAEERAHRACAPVLHGDHLYIVDVVSGATAYMGMWYDDDGAFMHY